MLEVRLRADFDELPFGKLAAEEEAEAFAEDEAATALSQFRSGAAGEVKEEEE